MEYDLAIIGWGAAGFSAAIKASELSNGEMRIALIGKGPMGGTCVNVGCVPSKFLIDRSIKFKNRYNSDNSALRKSEFSKVMDELRQMVRLSREKKYEEVIKNYRNVNVISGSATFLDKNTIMINRDGKNIEIKSSFILISTGSSPSFPPSIKMQYENILNSENIWNLDYLPEKIGIIGGGPVGLEIGQALRRFGVEVVIFEVDEEILPGYDKDVRMTVRKFMEEEGIMFETGKSIESIVSGNRKCVLFKGREECFDEIMIATGRSPNTTELNLEKIGVKTDGRGFIIVDNGMRTSVEGIYAAGDCTSSRLKLETLAAREGVVAAQNIFGFGSEINLNAVPWTIFTVPNVSGVGISEEEAMEKSIAFESRTVNLDSVVRNSIEKNRYGFAKMIIDKNSKKVLGLQIVSPEAGDFIIEGVYAVQFNMSIEDIINTVHIFPSHSEIVKIAAQSFKRDIGKMSCCME